MNNFWKQLKKPILCLAPMADVTDAAFRFIIAKYGKPDVMFTEFVSADGLCSAGREKLLTDLRYADIERPLVAQIFGSKPKNIECAAALCRELGFDGVDINMGCPDRSVEKQGAGAALMKNPALAREIIRAAQAGGGGLPVSVKTRIGYNKNNIEQWTAQLLEARPAAITLHLRTRKEMSKVPARWEEIHKAVALAKGTGTLILGNGDVATIAAAREKAVRYEVDGVMLGRGIFGNPWLFNEIIDAAAIDMTKKLTVMLEHTRLFENIFAGKKNFLIMRKHLAAYIKGYSNIKQLRTQLMTATTAAEVEKMVQMYYTKKEYEATPDIAKISQA